MKKYIKRKLVKLGILAALFGGVFMVVGVIGFMTSHHTQNALMTKKYKEKLMEEEQQQDEYSGDSLTLSPECEGYRSTVHDYAVQFGIEEYTDLVLAVMMQESGGRGSDVFQCSESMGLPPNTVSTAVSIGHGVKLIASYLSLAKVESPSDIIHIRLALQSYNFGTGYLSFAVDNYGGWTQEATNAYARKYSNGTMRTGTAAQIMGVWSYGDQYYTDHVLRYYALASTTIQTNSDIVEFAKTLLGCDYVWGATGPKTFDCSGLVYYVYKNTGAYTGARTTASGYKQIAKPISESEAKPGDLVFFTTASQGTHHIGIYIGDGKMIHAPQTGDVVKVSNVWRNGETVNYGRLSN